MVRTFPSILGLNPETNIEPKLAWLRENVDLDEGLVLGLVKVCVPMWWDPPAGPSFYFPPVGALSFGCTLFFLPGVSHGARISRLACVFDAGKYHAGAIYFCPRAGCT